MAKDYTLSKEEHQQIRQEISEEYLQGTSRAEQPRAIILAGQPGAGKSGLTREARAELERDGGAVIVDTDQLRDSHPDYDMLKSQNDRRAAGLVQKDSGQWADELTQDAMEQRRNLIIDGTLKNPDNARNLCDELKDQGYQVEVRAMAVAKEDSVQGVYGRYESQKAVDGSGRWVPEQVRDQAYEGMPRSLDTLEQGKHADRISVYRRGEDGPEMIHDGPGAAQALENERNRQRTPEELAARDQAWNRQASSPQDRDAGIMQRIEARDPGLKEPENQRAAELAGQARERASESTGKKSASPWPKQSRDKGPEHGAPQLGGKGK